MIKKTYRHGISDNLEQFLHQLFQVLLVGMTLGLMRTVVPALAETEFGVPRGSFLLLMAFVVAFGFVKGTLNFLAGRLSVWISLSDTESDIRSYVESSYHSPLKEDGTNVSCWVDPADLARQDLPDISTAVRDG